MQILKKKYQDNGYVKIKNFVSKDKKLKKLSYDLNNDLERAVKRTKINNIGGSIIGNLNVYPGKYGLEIFKILKRKGLDKIIKEITGKNINSFDILFGGNLSIPFGHNQHFHTDGNFKDKMILVNVATSNVGLNSGPTEIVLKSHRNYLKYWQFLIKKKKI